MGLELAGGKTSVLHIRVTRILTIFYSQPQYRHDAIILLYMSFIQSLCVMQYRHFQTLLPKTLSYYIFKLVI
jgi:hypothetical protein